MASSSKRKREDQPPLSPVFDDCVALRDFDAFTDPALKYVHDKIPTEHLSEAILHKQFTDSRVRDDANPHPLVHTNAIISDDDPLAEFTSIYRALLVRRSNEGKYF